LSDVPYSRPGIAGSGTIACGLAACATAAGEIIVLARSEKSANRASQEASQLCAQVDGGDASRLRLTTEADELADCDLVVEAIVEDVEAKVELLSHLGGVCKEADLATTTSSLSIADLGRRAGHSERMFGIHPFNPVPKMELVEVCVPQGAREGIAARARAWCESLGKTVVEVPDEPGFVVNRLLFPYLFDAVRLLERTGMEAEDVDRCMTLGAGHPMGPLALLDLVGIDVAAAIGEALHRESGDDSHLPPARLGELIADGKLGRKTGAGFYEYGEAA
jgi:3-hydroxybutyryl-CoA dehydrogenase